MGLIVAYLYYSTLLQHNPLKNNYFHLNSGITNQSGITSDWTWTRVFLLLNLTGRFTCIWPDPQPNWLREMKVLWVLEEDKEVCIDVGLTLSSATWNFNFLHSNLQPHAARHCTILPIYSYSHYFTNRAFLIIIHYDWCNPAYYHMNVSAILASIHNSHQKML